MATVNAISVALFNAAAGGYALQLAKDPVSFANAAGPILQRDIPNDTAFAELLLSNFGVSPLSPIYTQARRSLEDLIVKQGRAQAAITAIDFLKTQEAAANDYASVALNFAVKVNAATVYSTYNPTELDITKLISAVTGVDTDQVAINNALAAINPVFANNITTAVNAALNQAAADKAVEVANLKNLYDAQLKAASEKAASELKAATDKAAAEAAAAKIASEKALADALNALKVANDAAAQAAIRASLDKAAAVAAVDKTTDNAAAITSFLKTTAATMGLTGYESLSDTQLVNLIKYSDNQAIAAAVDKTIDNPAAITAFLRSAAKDLGVSGTATLNDAQLLTAIRTVNDAQVAAAVDLSTDNPAAITSYLRTTATGLGVTGAAAMDNAQLVEAIKTVNDAQVSANQLLIDTAAAAALKVQTDKAASDAAAALAAANNTIRQLQNLPGKVVTLSAGNDTVMGVSSGDDLVTATDLTYGNDDIVVDTSLSDHDTLNLSTTNDISATPVVVGFENINVNVTSVFAGSSLIAQLDFNANNIRNGSLNFDVTNLSSVVSGLNVSNLADGMVLTTSNEFTGVNISGKDRASVTYSGMPSSVSIGSDAGSFLNVTASLNRTLPSTIYTDATGSFTLSSAGDVAATANSASMVTVLSDAQATVNANAADIVSVTANEEVLLVANGAETVSISAGDGIDTSSAVSIDSRLVSANTNNIVVNVSGRGSSMVLDLNDAPNVNRVNVSGTQDVTIKVGLDDINGLGSATASLLDDNLLTVQNTSTGAVTLKVTSATGHADFSAANVTRIEVGAALDTPDDLTVASGASIVISVDQPNDLDVYAKNSAPSGGGNSVSISIKDNSSAGVSGDLAGGITFHNFSTATVTNNDTGNAASLGPVASVGGTVLSLTLASGPQGISETSSINLGNGTLRAVGVGPIDLGSAVTANDVAASDAQGAISIGLVGVGTVGTVVTGLGNDSVTISSAKRTAGDYSITTNGGNDTLTLNFVEGFTWDAGLGYDTLMTDYSWNLSLEAITLLGVDAISLDNSPSLGTDAVTLTISSATFNTNPVFTLLGGGSVVDTLVVTGTSDSDTINASGVAVEQNEALLALYGNAGNDIITGSAFADILVGGLGADILTGGGGGDTYIYDSNDVSDREQIVEVKSDPGIDTVLILNNLDLSPMIASSFDEIEAITLSRNVSATFTGLQLTGEVIALTGGSGTESLIVNLGAGETFVSGLTAGTSVEGIYYNGASGDEVITGSALGEIITGGPGNDVLTGNEGADRYVFSVAASNGTDLITFGTGDVLDFSGAAAFIGGHVVDKAIYSDASVTTTVASAATGDNILFLTGCYFADALAIKNAATLFTGCDTGNVLIVYAASASANTHIAVATLNDVGNVTAATDLAILVGMPIGTAATALFASSFVL